LRDTTLCSRYSVSLFKSVVFTAIVAGVAVLPFCLTAQSAPTPTPAASTEPVGQAGSSANPEAAKPDAAESEEEQRNNAFLYNGPLVKASAKALNLDIHTTAVIYEVLNFLIVIFGIGIPLFRFIPKFLRRRGEIVREKIEAARKATEDASKRLSAIEEKLAGLDQEITVFRVDVERESLQDEVRIKDALKEESVRIVQAAEQEIDSATAQARRNLRNFAADLAVEQATKQLVLTPEADRALITEFVSDLSRNGANKGGQN
jgi:F-type H+-transporting ATPase subunit b